MDVFSFTYLASQTPFAALGFPELGGLELGLTAYAIVTVYYSMLGAYILVRTKVISLKVAPLIVGYSVALWAISEIMYLNLPYLPTIYIISGITAGMQDVVIWAYILVRTRIISLKATPFTVVLALSLSIRAIVFMYSSLPIPPIFVVNQAFGITASVLLWTYILIKTKIISLKAMPLIAGYSVALWISSAIMLYLNLPYIPAVYIVTTVLPYPFTILVFFYLDRFRLRETGGAN